MWKIVAEEGLVCKECYHPIPTDAECLSQAPQELPDGVRRRSFENFCLRCQKCSARSEETPCYVRRLGHMFARKSLVEEDVACAHCGVSILEGKRALVQAFYTWPSTPEAVAEDEAEPSANLGGVTPSVAAAARGSASGEWSSLSAETQRRLTNGGLGSYRGGPRTPTEAEQFYRTSVPRHVRDVGNSAVREYLDGKEASHITSVRNDPSLARDPSNIVWEDTASNRSRGARDMTAGEKHAARMGNVRDAAKIGGKEAIRRGVRGGLVAGAMELPVATVENYFHWRRARKPGAHAIRDTAKSTGTTAGMACLVSATAFLVPISLGPLAMPITVAGMAMWAGKAIHRIAGAARPDLPLLVYRVYICSERACRSGFAYAVIGAQ